MPQHEASSQAESIDVSSTTAVEDLAKRFDATPQQIREAVKALEAASRAWSFAKELAVQATNNAWTASLEALT